MKRCRDKIQMKNAGRKRLLFVCLAALVLLACPFRASAEEIVHSGTSMYLDWSIDSDGLLTISGRGDYNAPTWSSEQKRYISAWNIYADEIYAAVVDVSGIESTKHMFYGCDKLEMVDLRHLDTSFVTDMNGMFFGCTSLESIMFSSSFRTGDVTDMHEMFSGCKSLENLDVSGFDTGKVTTMQDMFSDCSSLKSLDVHTFDTSKVTNMNSMFFGCSSLKNLDVSTLNTSSAEYMHTMFSGCSSMESIDISHFDLKNAQDIGGMFSSCGSLKSVNMEGLDLSNVTDISGLFWGCAFTSLELKGLDTSNVTDMSTMFYECKNLESLDFGSLNVAKVDTMYYIFKECPNLKKIRVPAGINCKEDVELPVVSGCYWLDENGAVRTTVAKGLTVPMCYTRHDGTPPTTTPAPTPIPTQKPAPIAASATPKPKGTTIKAADGKNDYKVTAAGKVAAVTFQKAFSNAVSVTIPGTIKDDAGAQYKVTAIAANSFKNDKKVKAVTIGKNVTTIGKNAFNGCKKLKTITIKSTKIKVIKSGAFKNLPKNATAKVPKSKKKDYKKLLQKAGFKGKVVAK